MNSSIASLAGFGFDDRYDDGWESDIADHESGPIGSERQEIPPRLDKMAPGPVLGAFLSSVELEELSAYDRVIVLRARQRMASHYAAMVYSDMVSIADAYESEFPHRSDHDNVGSAADEIRCALHLTRSAADTEFACALDLYRRLPKVHDMLKTGLIDVRRAKTIDRETSHLSIGAARGVVERITEAAPQLTTGELRERIKKLCIEADTHEAKKRYEQAVDNRKVIAEPTIDGTANLLGLDLAPGKVAAVTQRINQIARSLRGGGESRTMDQLRADIYLFVRCQRPERSLRSLPETRWFRFWYLVSGIWLLESDPQVAADQPGAEWQYTITDTETGQHLCDGVTRRRPTASQQRHIESRDRTCVFPGCRMPSSESRSQIVRCAHSQKPDGSDSGIWYLASGI